MTRARATLVSVEDTPYYHCIGRCVRRAFLCGFDRTSGKSYEHRRDWIEARLKVLTDVFAIDLCAYALMSNHYHLVVKLNPTAATEWSDLEIIGRWTQLFRGPPVAGKALRDQPLSSAERGHLDQLVSTWRKRLSDLSWFMRCLNEAIARMANAEDGCTGHFWESRFKSQALLDDTALLTAMAYVDLNPIRAKMAESVQGSDYTSGQARVREITGTLAAENTSSPPRLLPFMGSDRRDRPDHIPFNVQDYLDLLDSTGRVIQAGKRGAIPHTAPALLTMLGVRPEEWLSTVTALQRRFELAIGGPNRLQQLAERWGKRWVRGMTSSRRLYPEPSG